MYLHSCYQDDRQINAVPVRCFERHDCVGLHGVSEEACSTKYRISIEAKIKQSKNESAAEDTQEALGSSDV